MRLGLVSLDQRWEDKPANQQRCAAFAADAARQGCDAVVFPEMTLTGFSINVDRTAEDARSSPTLDWFGSLTRDTNVSIFFGACLTHVGSPRPRNVLCLTRPDGRTEVLYAKIHPFTYAGEHDVLEPGEELGRAQLGAVRIGLAICYDLRFPEMYAALAPDCDIVITIANWPERRLAHWRALLVARAIENQCVMVGVNRIGTDGNGLRHQKSTMVVAPEGNILQPVLGGGELDVYDVDVDAVERYRAEFPTVRDKRPGVYRRLLDGVDAHR